MDSASTLQEFVAPAFARHETFHPRYGWLKKGVDAARRSSGAFTVETAPVDLGVGKNMVKAIRFWCRAAKLLTEVENPSNPRRPLTVPTNNAIALFDENRGLDPYLEIEGSPWLLHWWMLSPRCLLPVWWVAMNRFSAVEFDTGDLQRTVMDTVVALPDWPSTSSSAIAKDVDCFLRMYAARSSTRGLVDDLVDSPFRELGLIEPVLGSHGRYRFIVGPKHSLPDALVAFACLDYLSRTDMRGRVTAIHQLVRSPGSPGRVFKLTEAALTSALERHAESADTAVLMSAAGVKQLAVPENAAGDARKILRDYYNDAGSGVARPIVLGGEPAGHSAASMQFVTDELLSETTRT